MSYCVNCGVELEESAKKCALCGTEVLNPKSKPTVSSEPHFADENHIPESVSRKFIAKVISMVMFIPCLVCLLANAVFFPESFWSLYIFSTGFLAWVIFVFPFFTSKRKPYLMWAFDTVAVLFYVYLIFAISGLGNGIYLTTALPIILVISLQMLIYMLWAIGKKRHIILKVLHLFVDFAIFSLLCGLVLSAGLSLKIAAAIGIIIFISCLCIVGFLVYCYNSKSARRYLSKRFFT